MDTKSQEEARRQIEICNACRYCEGYCSVFPAITLERSFSSGDITQLANLCHNCRGCYYACQYTEPHEFAINIPQALGAVRQESWEEFAYPSAFARAFQRSGVAIMAAAILGFALLIFVARWLGENSGGEGFYAVLSHNAMVAIFLPAFLLPIAAITLSLRRYWRTVGAGKATMADFLTALKDAASMKNLSGGHGEGCNYEDEDRFSRMRKHCHNGALFGFLYCFAATSVATIMHYGFGLEAPYPLLSAPKILGILGGILLSGGTAGLAWLKTRADKNLGAPKVWGGEMGFVLLLFTVSTSGLVLYAFGDTPALSYLLALHLGSVLAFFLLTPYSKMAHGFYRLTALTVDAHKRRVREEGLREMEAPADLRS